jgi:glycosyltransferase involved in cell wall biosynthesis
MKIAAILDNTVDVGGGYNQSVNAILQIHRLCANRFKLDVYTTDKQNVKILQEIGINASFIKYHLLDQIFLNLCNNQFWQKIQCRIKWICPFEKRLLDNGCDLIYFVTQSNNAAAIQTINYITTLMDLCHRDMLEFPEVRCFGRFFLRESYFKYNLLPAYLILTDSEKLADAAALRYGIDRDRFLPMPYSPSPFLNQTGDSNNNAILRKYRLIPGYFFYPAQFWAHKNHIRILQALVILKNKGFFPNVVFSGNDHGNRVHIEHFVKENDLMSQVNILGFVDKNDMWGLYENAMAVVMPTYFGPTNIPPIEAWVVGKPVIYSEHLSEQVEDAALLIDPDDANGLANAMLAFGDPLEINRLVAAGKQRLSTINEQRNHAEKELLKKLESFSARRQCWR